MCVSVCVCVCARRDWGWLVIFGVNQIDFAYVIQADVLVRSMLYSAGSLYFNFQSNPTIHIAFGPGSSMCLNEYSWIQIGVVSSSHLVWGYFRQNVVFLIILLFY